MNIKFWVQSTITELGNNQGKESQCLHHLQKKLISELVKESCEKDEKALSGFDESKISCFILVLFLISITKKENDYKYLCLIVIIELFKNPNYVSIVDFIFSITYYRICLDKQDYMVYGNS